MKKILITGASGFTGRHACEYYTKKGYDVYGLVHSQSLSSKQIQSIHCDLFDIEGLIEVLKVVKPRFILHLAAQNHSGRSWEDPVSTINTNVIGTMNLLEAVKKSVPDATLLIVGSVIEYNPCHSSLPNHPYGLSKYIQTLLTLCWSTFYDLDIRIAKSSNLIGPGHSTGICSLLAQKCLQYRDDKSISFHFHNVLDNRDFVDVRDAVEAYDIILQRGEKNESYIVSSGKNYRFLKVAKELKSISQSDLPLTTDHFYPTADIRHEHTKLCELDWKPKHSLQNSLKDIIDYYVRG
ncbi:NAD-dependent epimerase/dehydratase family protein [Bacillus sp. BHET2]|uniref:NAD-dependent epimerase/dehydratase family protein n=1 Tax=Bacillus sp. BHET2 TaxID=2583818 RepID=UPI0014867CFB|nr:NAD-dependent epimerase/dehydratase family protein [Bacillus sp. BHET2]